MVRFSKFVLGFNRDERLLIGFSNGKVINCFQKHVSFILFRNYVITIYRVICLNTFFLNLLFCFTVTFGLNTCRQLRPTMFTSINRSCNNLFLNYFFKNSFYSTINPQSIAPYSTCIYHIKITYSR